MKESSLSLSLRRSVRTQGSFDSRGLLFPHVRAAPRESLYRTWENTGLCLVTFVRAGGGRWRRRRRPSFVAKSERMEGHVCAGLDGGSKGEWPIRLRTPRRYVKVGLG